MLTRSARAASGFSLIGLLVSMACMVMLFAVLMTGLNKAVTGEGSVRQNTVRSVEDKLILKQIMQAMILHAGDNDGWYLVPSRLSGSGDRGEDTTASFYSAMVALRYVTPGMLVSANEYSGFVEPMEDYDYLAYRPVDGSFWDPRFKADLDDLSNVSFAHLPMFGDRHVKHWRTTYDGTFAIMGSRGPRDGVADPDSWTYGRDGTWAGHLAFGDGHVDFVSEFVPAGSVRDENGRPVPDNVFAAEEGPSGGDCVLSFTRRMTGAGPELQWD